MPPELAAYLTLRAAATRRCEETTRQALRHVAERFDDKVAERIAKRAYRTLEPACRGWFNRLAT